MAQKIASIQRRPACLASRQRVIINVKDMDQYYLFHAALELEVLCKRAGKGNAVLAKWTIIRPNLRLSVQLKLSHMENVYL